MLFPCLTHACVAGSDSEMLPWLLSEFPFLYLSPETVHDLWRKGSRQLELLSRASTEVKRKKSKAQVEVFNATELCIRCAPYMLPKSFTVTELCCIHVAYFMNFEVLGVNAGFSIRISISFSSPTSVCEYSRCWCLASN